MTIELEAALPATRAGRLLECMSHRRRPIIGAAGDSIADALMGEGANQGASSSFMIGLSPLFWALLEHPADVLIDGRSYANGGYNFGVGGSTSAQMVANQTAQVAARVGDLLFVQTGQNDNVSTKAIADASASNIETFAASALAAGWAMVAIIGLPPSNNINVADRPKAVEHFNRRLLNFARRTPGVVFLDVTPLVMDPASASTSQVRFRGTANTVGAFSDDGTHYTAEGARAQAPLIAPLLQRLARPRVPRMAYRHAYDQINCPQGSLFGSYGLFTGTGGLLNSVANANLAEGWTLTSGSGITATPTLVTDADGYIAQRLTFSGTASAYVDIVLGLAAGTYISPAPGPGDFGMEAMLNAIALTGTSDIKLQATLGGISAFFGTTGRLPPLTQRMFAATRRPVAFTSGESFLARLTLSFASGAIAGGSIEISRFGVFLEP